MINVKLFWLSYVTRCQETGVPITIACSVNTDPDFIKAQALKSKGFWFDIDSARGVFGTWIGGGFSQNPEEKKMLHLAWSNCT